MALIAWYPLNGNTRNYAGVGGDLLAGAGAYMWSPTGRGCRVAATNTGIRMKDLGKEWSVAFWFNPLADTSTSRLLVGARDGALSGLGGVSRPGSIFAYPTTNDLHFSSASSSFVEGGFWPSNTWTHCIMTVAADGTVKFYRNGELYGSPTANYSDVSLGLYLHIGSGLPADAECAMMSDVRVYDHRLSKREIRDAYKSCVFRMNFNTPRGNRKNLDPGDNAITNSAYTYPVSPALHRGAITVNGWSTGYNGGVPEPTIGHHAHWVSQNGEPVLVQRNLNGAFGHPNRWMGSAKGVGTGTAAGFAHGTVVTMCWDQWSSTGGGASVGLYHKRLLDGTNTFGPTRVKVNSTPGKWERVSFTFTVDSDWDLASAMSLYVYGYYSGDGTILMTKNHKFYIGRGNDVHTLGAEGTTETITDDTGLVEMSMQNVAWDNSDEIGTGCADFDKSGVFDVTGHFLPGKRMTLMGWLKLRSYPTDQSPIFEYGPYLNVHANGAVKAYWHNTSNPGYHSTSAGDVPLNQLAFIAATWDGANLRIYVNGVKKRTIAVDSITVGSHYSHFRVGNHSGSRSFDGKIYECSIHAMAWSDAEILEEYQRRGSIDKLGNLHVRGVEEGVRHGGATTIEIGGFSADSTSDKNGIKLNGTERSYKTRGLNFMVLDENGRYRYRAKFDLYSGTSGSVVHDVIAGTTTTVASYVDLAACQQAFLAWFRSIPYGYYVFFHSHDAYYLTDEIWTTMSESLGLNWRPYNYYRTMWYGAGRIGGELLLEVNNGNSNSHSTTISIDFRNAPTSNGVMNVTAIKEGLTHEYAGIALDNGEPMYVQGGWVRVYRLARHNSELFDDLAEAQYCNAFDPSANKYSILSYLEKFRKGGKFRFKLAWPEKGTSNIFEQTSNPVTSAIGVVTDLVNIHCDYTGNNWTGLNRSASTTQSLIDGDVGSSWWYSVGTLAEHAGGIPGGNSIVMQEVELWVYVGPDANNFSISKTDGVLCGELVEN